MTTCFDDPAKVAALPAPIAEAVQVMLDEIISSGEHTTADVTVNAIDPTVAHLGRLWGTEYLAAGAPDPAINADLYAGLDKRDPGVGQWVGLCRRLRATFVGGKYPTIVPHREALDFGDLGQSDHPIARLVTYRNSFGHGSLQAVTEDIRTHRLLLAENHRTDGPAQQEVKSPAQ